MSSNINYNNIIYWRYVVHYVNNTKYKRQFYVFQYVHYTGHYSDNKNYNEQVNFVNQLIFINRFNIYQTSYSVNYTIFIFNNNFL